MYVNYSSVCLLFKFYVNYSSFADLPFVEWEMQVTLHCRFRLWEISQPSVSVPPLRGRLGGG